MSVDFTVNRECHIVPANIPNFTARSIVKFHVKHGVWLQPLLRGDHIILDLTLPQCGDSGFLCYGYDLRVIPHQSGVDILVSHFCGFGLRCPLIAEEQGYAIIKSDGHIACAAPFSGTGGSYDLAGCTAESLCDDPDLVLHGQTFIFRGYLHRLFLQVHPIVPPCPCDADGRRAAPPVPLSPPQAGHGWRAYDQKRFSCRPVPALSAQPLFPSAGRSR